MSKDLKSRLNSLTVKELKNLAEEKDIDLGKAKKKADITKKIIESEMVDISYFEDDSETEDSQEEDVMDDDDETDDDLAEQKEDEDEGESETPIETEKDDIEEETVFSEEEFENALENINRELEEIGAHITQTLGKIAGIDEVTDEELRLINENIRSTSHVDVDFDEPKQHLTDAKRFFDKGSWVDSFNATLEAMETIDRQTMGFRKVAYARAIESCERIIEQYPKSTEGVPRMEHELLYAKLLFTKGDAKRMLEVMFVLHELMDKLPKIERRTDEQTAVNRDNKTPGEPKTVEKRGKCKKCGSKDLTFYSNGTGKCNNCTRVFVWQKKTPQKTTLKDLLKRN